MSEKKEQVRLGSGKTINETFFGSSFCLTDAMQYAYEYNGKKYVNINISIYEKPDNYGKNLKITLNDYKGKTETKVEPKTIVNTKDDLPF
jgi:hypothetical protein